jgi:hypothetical protein
VEQFDSALSTTSENPGLDDPIIRRQKDGGRSDPPSQDQCRRHQFRYDTAEHRPGQHGRRMNYEVEKISTSMTSTSSAHDHTCESRSGSDTLSEATEMVLVSIVGDAGRRKAEASLPTYFQSAFTYLFGCKTQRVLENSAYWGP